MTYLLGITLLFSAGTANSLSSPDPIVAADVVILAAPVRTLPDGTSLAGYEGDLPAHYQVLEVIKGTGLKAGNLIELSGFSRYTLQEPHLG